MQDHWSKVHKDMRSIYEELSASGGTESGEDKAAASAESPPSNL